jgi:hypothetical protein
VEEVRQLLKRRRASSAPTCSRLVLDEARTAVPRGVSFLARDCS